MTKEEFLLDTLKYYCEDTTRRCSSPNGKCHYSPRAIDKKNSNGCAIGRMLNEESRDKFEESNTSIWNIRENHPRLVSLMPKWMAEMDLEFLREIQILHDHYNNWDNFGLTKRGIASINDIIIRNNLNPNLFTQYTTIS